MIRASLAALGHFHRRASALPTRSARSIRGLDKITGQARDYTLTVGRAARIGSLEVIARSCSKSAPEETPEVRIYVEVFDTRRRAKAKRANAARFSTAGCSLRARASARVDHPTYDIWAIDCRS